MENDCTHSILLVSMPFASVTIPSIQLSILGGYLKERDVKVKTKSLFLKAADIYGLSNYKLFTNPPNDSYSAQMIFSKYVFPNHWEKNKSKFDNYFNNSIIASQKENTTLSFEDYIEKSEQFYQWVISNVDWSSFDIIGFSLNYGQLLPSLAVAKSLKEKWSEKKIILGGSRVADKMGEKILHYFNFIDYIVSGDGEEALYNLAMNKDPGIIPGVVYREKNKIIRNQLKQVDLDKSPMPSFVSFFQDLSSLSDILRQHFFYEGRLPVEISRGCWWNKCTFCNVNIQCPRYREKSIDRIIQEISTLSSQYSMLDFQLIGNTLPKDLHSFCNKILNLQKDFSFVAEARAGRLTREDYTLLKSTGFHNIQTGVESFSSHYLKKMEKGTRVIDNIAALKFCKENRIKNHYNIVVNYPNEEVKDFEETSNTIHLFNQYIDPPNICHLRIFYGSPIYKNPTTYNIKSIIPTVIDKIMFPPEILDNDFCFVYDYDCIKKSDDNNWEALIDNWKQIFNEFEQRSLKEQSMVKSYVLYFVDGGNFLKIYDKRNPENVQIHVLDKQERTIFLSCINVISYEKLQEQLPHIKDYELAATLHSFEQIGIVYGEENYYVCLPLSYKTLNGSLINLEKEKCVYNSGIQRSL